MLPVTKIQRFSTRDGPGVRTTVFLKDCPLRCVWCHNPETQPGAPSLFYAKNLCIQCGLCAKACPRGAHTFTESGHLWDPELCDGCLRCAEACVTGALEAARSFMTQDGIYDEVMKDAAFYGEKGGVTFSGGEPTVHADELLMLLARFHRSGIGTAIETCGYFDPSLLADLVPVTDLFLWDVKDTDDRRHRANTGVSNRRILENLRLADRLGARTVLRCILIKTVNFEISHFETLARLYDTLTHCDGVELIPYHTYGVSKSLQLGMPGEAHEEWIPSAEDLKQAEAYLATRLPVIAH